MGKENTLCSSAKFIVFMYTSLTFFAFFWAVEMSAKTTAEIVVGFNIELTFIVSLIMYVLYNMKFAGAYFFTLTFAFLWIFNPILIIEWVNRSGILKII